MFALGLGEVAAISAAIVWAGSTVLYKRFSHQLSPLELNVAKGLIAGSLMLVILVASLDVLYPKEMSSWVWLITSGLVGIAIGDSAYFAALKYIGPARTLVIESLAPALVGILNIFILGVHLPPLAWVGIAVTTLGVMIAVKPSDKLPKVETTLYVKGALCALLAAFCQAAGMVLSKGAVNTEEISSMWAAFIRLASGTVAVACLVAVFKQYSLKKAVTLDGISDRRWLCMAVFFGTFIGLWLQLVSVKHTDPAIAQTIFATAPLMVMTLALIRREHLTPAMIWGGVTALSGVVLLLNH